MENPKNQLASKLKDASNVLVTVSTNPSVDQLSAAIGLTLYLTKMKKHATTVFSGQVPSTIDFLKPEETIENNTDSLRDFIISLDKNKADKIRYKVEDTMVKIFITPYRTSIGDQDLVFSQGDFNVDVVIALGIHNKEDLDQAITAHGRILHDATVATVNTKDASDIGTLNWIDQQASSLCEMAVALTDLIKANSLDGQMATAFLTGIVAETERFSNERTTSTTMNASAKLMAAGANQQLVATKLEPLEGSPAAPKQPQGPEGGEEPQDVSIDDDGALRIDHESSIPEPERVKPAPPPSDTLPPPVMPEPEPEPEPVSQVKIDEEGQLQVEEPHIKQEHRQFLSGQPDAGENTKDLFGLPSDDRPAGEPGSVGAMLVTEPPQFGGQLSAAADDSSDSASPLNLPSVNTPLLSHDSGSASKKENKKADKDDHPPTPPPPPPAPPKPLAPPPPTGQAFVDMGDNTLDDIEHKVGDAAPQLGSQKPHTKLPEQFVKSLDDSTLTGLEEKVESPHIKTRPQPSPDTEVDYHKVAAEQVAKAVSGKTLNEIEQRVDSPHIQTKPGDTKPAVLPSAFSAKADEGPKFDYEPHESEPPDNTAATDDPAVADDFQAAQDDAAAADDQPQDHAVPVVDDTKPVTDDTAGKTEEKSTDKAKTDAKDDNLKDKTDEARDAVMQAISAGGDGRTSLPPLESIGAAGSMPVSHDNSQPRPQTPSSQIDIDEKGNLTFPQNLVPTTDELPEDATASPADSAAAPPPVPPPMMPPLPQQEE